MPTDSTEIGLFQDFMSKHENGSSFATLDEAIGAFRRYQHELADARTKVQVGIEQADRGECEPLDIDAAVSDVRERLASEGITD